MRATTRLRPRASSRQRRGATLVIVAITISVLFMFAGLAVDFGRLNFIVSRHESLADAVALSSLVDRRRNLSWNELVTYANAVYAANPVSDVSSRQMLLEAGQWDYTTRTFTPASWDGTTASRVTGTVGVNWTFARIFGSASRTTRVEAIASMAAIRSTNCLKPFLMPYGALLSRIGRSSQVVTHQLTPTDFQRIRQLGTVEAFAIGTATAVSTANVVTAAFRTPTNSEQDLAAALQPSCSAPVTVSVNQELFGYSGTLASTTVTNALGLLCGGSGDVWTRTCSSAQVIEVPIFDQVTTSGGQTRYRVRYIGGFRLTRLSRDNGVDRIHGHFTTIAKTGAGDVLPMLGPVFRSALVR